MIASYSMESGILLGAKETFSGERPCNLCKTIAEAKKAEGGKKQDAPAPTQSAKQAHDFLASREAALEPPSATTAPTILFFGHLFQDGTSAHAPPLPPPRWGARAHS